MRGERTKEKNFCSLLPYREILYERDRGVAAEC